MGLIQKTNILSKRYWISGILKLINCMQLSNFCCIITLRQGTLLIAVIELSLTSFVLFLLLLGATHVQEIVDLVSSDLQQLEENSRNSWSFNRFEELSIYLTNNEQKMLTGQHLATITMILVYSGLIVTSIHFISCLLLLYGAVRNSPRHLLPWTLTVLISIISGCLFLFLLVFVPSEECKFGTYAAGIALLGLEIYAWLVVFSYYRQLIS